MSKTVKKKKNYRKKRFFFFKWNSIYFNNLICIDTGGEFPTLVQPLSINEKHSKFILVFFKFFFFFFFDF